MNALEALDWVVYIVIAVLAPQDWDEALIERHVKDPVEQEDHVLKQFNDVFWVVLAVLQEIVHIEKQCQDGNQVQDPEYDERPVEKCGPWVIYGCDQSAVAAQLDYEVQKELVFPSITLILD